jgi:peptidoglycan/LPS O-acetylase OafA/YrhL
MLLLKVIEMIERKNHNATLDGLRGIAAFSVVFFHLSFGPNNTSPISKAYLAVDFFFALSGFVIAKAYEKKLSERLSLFEFIKIRVIRLYPLVFIATLMAMFKLISRGGGDALSENSGRPNFRRAASTASLCWQFVNVSA